MCFHTETQSITKKWLIAERPANPIAALVKTRLAPRLDGDSKGWTRPPSRDLRRNRNNSASVVHCFK